MPVAAKSHLPVKNTRPAIKAYVEEARAYVAKHGADCTALSSSDFKGGDYYIFVFSRNGKTVCHPTQAGKMASEIVDAKGRKVGDEIVATGKKKGGGWVEYEWPRPGSTKPVAKSSYARSVKAPDGKWYIVGSGGYEVK